MCIRDRGLHSQLAELQNCWGGSVDNANNNDDTVSGIHKLGLHSQLPELQNCWGGSVDNANNNDDTVSGIHKQAEAIGCLLYTSRCV